MFEDSDNPVRPKNYQTIQWPLNQAAYQNLANDQVDWAALAQQWIQMKETFPPEFVPAAPPPPLVTFKDFEEKGEAPMEVDKEEEAPPAPIISGISTQSSNWNPGWTSFSNQTQWRTNYNTNKEYGSDDKEAKSVKPFSQIGSGWSSWSNTKITPTQPLSLSRQPLLQAPTVPSFTTFNNNTNNFASVPLESDPYWMHKTKLPDTLNNNAKELPGNFSDTDTKNDDLADHDDSAQTLDNAKRKLLPAWIREGLEKMEREKLKEEEKERELKEKELLLQKRRKEEEEILKELEREKRTKSRFESDSEEELVDRQKPGLSHGKYSGFKEKETKREPSPQKLKPYRTKEEQIQDIMLTVRKTLTEILLDVTNEEILDIAKQTVTKSRRKAPTAQALRKTALTSLTGGLGLGIYGDSSGESSDSDSETKKMTDNKDDKEMDDIDSDAELEEIIKRRKAAFEKTSREIEAQIAEEEEREERRRRDRGSTNSGGPSGGNRNNKTDSDEDSDNDTTYNNNNKRSHDNNDQFVKKRDGETQLLDKNYSKSGWSMRDKKPSRFSDPRDTVRNTHLTHVSIVSSDQVGTKRMDNDGGGPSSSSGGNTHHNHKGVRNKARDKSSQSSDDTATSINKKKSKKQYKTTSGSSSTNSKNKKLSRSSNDESNEEDLTETKLKNYRASDSVSSSKRSSRSTDRSIRRSRSRDSRVKESRSKHKRSRSKSNERYRSRSRDRYTKRISSNKSYRDRSRERRRYKSRSRSRDSRDRSYSRSSYSRKNKSRERERSKSKSRDRKTSKNTKESK